MEDVSCTPALQTRSPDNTDLKNPGAIYFFLLFFFFFFQMASAQEERKGKKRGKMAKEGGGRDGEKSQSILNQLS